MCVFEIISSYSGFCVCFSLCLCVCIYVCLSVRVSVCLVCLSIYQSACLDVYLNLCMCACFLSVLYIGLPEYYSASCICVWISLVWVHLGVFCMCTCAYEECVGGVSNVYGTSKAVLHRQCSLMPFQPKERVSSEAMFVACSSYVGWWLTPLNEQLNFTMWITKYGPIGLYNFYRADWVMCIKCNKWQLCVLHNGHNRTNW